MKPKKPLKIILGIVVFLTLPSLIFFGYLYAKNHEDLPVGVEGKAADDLATKMLVALNYEAYLNTDYIGWTFKNRRHYEWEKTQNICDVFWKDYKIRLDLKNHSESKAYVHGFTIEGEMGIELVNKALNYFQKDIFWLVAPFQVFDTDVKRELVTLDNNEKALLVTYKNNDAYLWHLDNTGKPKHLNMWDSRTPINGLKASYGKWQITETGVNLPTFHKVLFTGLVISDLETH